METIIQAYFAVNIFLAGAYYISITEGLDAPKTPSEYAVLILTTIVMVIAGIPIYIAIAISNMRNK